MVVIILALINVLCAELKNDSVFAFSQEMLKPSVLDMSLKITHLDNSNISQRPMS